MKTLQVSVTQQNIDEAERSTCCKCPIAQAINTREHNVYPRNVDASVHLKDGWFTRREEQNQLGILYAFEMPTAATAFIESYQNKEAVAPFQFTLKLRLKGPRTAWSGTL